MDTLGEFLKNKRESKNETLEDIAAQTRINLPFLQAVEADDWEQFSSEVIARGFVRAYAVSLGLDEGEVLGRFDQIVRPIYQEKQESQPPNQSYANQVFRAKPLQARRKNLGQIALISLTAIVLVGLYMIGSKRFNEEPVIVTRNSQEPVLLSEPGTIETMPDIKEDVLGDNMGLAMNPPGETEPSPLVVAPVATPSEPAQADVVDRPVTQFLTLSVEAMETSWVSVRIDEGETREVLLQPGEEVIWIAENQFTLDLGNAGGAKVKLNGESLEAFGPPGAVIKNIVLTRDSVPEPIEGIDFMGIVPAD